MLIVTDASILDGSCLLFIDITLAIFFYINVVERDGDSELLLRNGPCPLCPLFSRSRHMKQISHHVFKTMLIG